MSALRRLLLFLMATRPFQFFLGNILPRLRFSTSPPQMSGNQFRRFIAIIRPGDIVFSTDRSKLSSMIIPGPWDHVAVVAKDGEIIEAHFPKVRKISAFDFCHTSDTVGILRPFEDTGLKIAERAERLIGIPYDTLFVDGREALYCSELVWECDRENAMKFDTSDEIGLGIAYLSPTGIWESKNIVGKTDFTDSSLEDGI